MSGDSSGTKKLGKILLQQKLVTPSELEGMLDEQHKRGGKLASTAARNGVITVTDALHVLSEQHGVPAVDLSRQVVPTSNLVLIPEELAREHGVFPVEIQGDQLLLAMVTPQNAESIEELQFVTALIVQPHIALDDAVRRAIDMAYSLLARGEPYYVGERVPDAQLEELGIGRPLNADGTLQEYVASEELPASEPPTPPSQPQAEPAAAVVQARGEPAEAPVVESAAAAVVAALKEPAPAPAAQPMRATSGKKVLVVDDDEDARALIRLNLEHIGVSVIEASGGTAALEALREHSPDMIVLDAVMPGIHGFDLCRRLRQSQRYGAIPIVIVSAIHRDWRVAEDLREAYGVEHVFEKPFDMQRFGKTISQLLDGKHADDQSAVLSAAAERELSAGMDAFEKGDMSRAIAHLRRGANIDPLAFELQYQLGLLYGRSDDAFAAIEALETAVGISPRHFSALKNLAVMYQRAGFRHKALEAWQRAMANAPDGDTRATIKEHMVTLL